MLRLYGSKDEKERIVRDENVISAGLGTTPERLGVKR